MENPCRYCVAPKRCEGCHDRCRDYKKWVFLQRIDWKNEYRERLVTMQIIEMKNDAKPVRSKPEPLKHGRKVAYSPKFQI